MGTTIIVSMTVLLGVVTQALSQNAGDCRAIEDTYGSHTGIMNSYIGSNWFYQMTLSHVEWGTGYFTWASKNDSNGSPMTFVEYENPNMYYSPGNLWYNDTLWAFVDTNRSGWFYLINCRYPDKYLTISSLEYTYDNLNPSLVLDDLNRRAPEMYMWRPISYENNKHIIVPLFRGDLWIQQSDDVYKWKSYVMKAGEMSQTSTSQKAKYLFSIDRAKYF